MLPLFNFFLMRNIIIIAIHFQLSIAGFSQILPFEARFGLASNYSKLNGRGKLEVISFERDLQKPTIYAGFSYIASKRIGFSIEYIPEILSSHYTIPSIDITGKEIRLEYKTEAVYSTFKINPSFLFYKNVILSVGTTISILHMDRWRLLNLNDFSVPTFAPSYGEFDYKPINIGLEVGLIQPLFSWKLSRVDLGLYYNNGITNINKNNENPLKTSVFGLKLYWNVNLQKRIKKEKEN